MSSKHVRLYITSSHSMWTLWRAFPYYLLSMYAYVIHKYLSSCYPIRPSILSRKVDKEPPTHVARLRHASLEFTTHCRCKSGEEIGKEMPPCISLSSSRTTRNLIPNNSTICTRRRQSTHDKNRLSSVIFWPLSSLLLLLVFSCIAPQQNLLELHLKGQQCEDHSVSSKLG